MKSKTNLSGRGIFTSKDNKKYNILECPTFEANIFIGLKDGYNGRVPSFAKEIVQKVCQSYCDSVGLAVTLEETFFIYTNGNEPGVKVGLINYPRYPKTKHEIISHALYIADKLKSEFKQYRVSVVTSDNTYMLGEI